MLILWLSLMFYAPAIFNDLNLIDKDGNVFGVVVEEEEPTTEGD